MEEIDTLTGRTARELDEARRVLTGLRMRARELADSYEGLARLLRDSPERAGEMAELDLTLRTDLAVNIAEFGREIVAAAARHRELENRKRELLPNN